MEDNFPQESNKDKKKKDKKEKPDRGIDTMFRTTLNNHNNLSGLVDNKANILLSVNAIIISVCLSTILPKLDNLSKAYLVIPTLTLILSSVISIIFAILATRPGKTNGSFTRNDVNQKKVNLLFFGNFYKVKYEDYNWAMNELIKDKQFLYDSMIKDLYYLGIVLDKKYKLIRIAYTLFMIGIIISVFAFLIAFKFR